MVVEGGAARSALNRRGETSPVPMWWGNDGPIPYASRISVRSSATRAYTAGGRDRVQIQSFHSLGGCAFCRAPSHSADLALFYDTDRGELTGRRGTALRGP